MSKGNNDEEDISGLIKFRVFPLFPLEIFSKSWKYVMKVGAVRGSAFSQEAMTIILYRRCSLQAEGEEQPIECKGDYAILC